MNKWIDVGSDVDWVDHGGNWSRMAPDGSFYFLEWIDIWDATGEDTGDRYVCEVKRVDLRDCPPADLARAADFVGIRHDDEISPLDLAYACAQYGLSAPVHSESGTKYPLRIRAAARRAADEMIADSDALETALDRPVNAIGSTARDFGKGNITAGLDRYIDSVRSGERAADDTGMNIMAKLHGQPLETK